MGKFDEYYVVVDEVQKDVSVCMYMFDDDHPSGFERKVFTRGYGESSAFNLDEAKGFCNRLCDIFNSKRFRRESISYGKSRN